MAWQTMLGGVFIVGQAVGPCSSPIQIKFSKKSYPCCHPWILYIYIYKCFNDDCGLAASHSDSCTPLSNAPDSGGDKVKRLYEMRNSGERILLYL